MLSFFQKFREFISHPSHSRTMGLLVMLVLVSAVALTVIVSQQQQTIKQQAYSTCDGYSPCDGNCKPGCCEYDYEQNCEYCDTWADLCRPGTPDACPGGCSHLTNDCNLGECDYSARECKRIPINGGGSCDGGTGSCDYNGNCIPNPAPPPPADECFGGWDCDDNDPCTNDNCDNHRCTHSPASEFIIPFVRRTCTINGNPGTCDGNGHCVIAANECDLGPDCDDNNACTNDNCDNHRCAHSPASEFIMPFVRRVCTDPTTGKNGTCDGNSHCSATTPCSTDGATCTDNTGTKTNECSGTDAVKLFTCDDQNKCSLSYTNQCPSGTSCKLSPNNTAYCDTAIADTCSPKGYTCTSGESCAQGFVEDTNYSCGDSRICCKPSNLTGKCQFDNTTKICTDPDGRTTHKPICNGSSADNYNCDDGADKPCKKTSIICTANQTCTVENYIAKCIPKPSTPPIPSNVPIPTNPPPGFTPTPSSTPIPTVILVSALNVQDVTLTAISINTSLSLYNLTTNTVVTGAPATQTYNSTVIPGRQYSTEITLTNLYQEKYFIVIRYNNMIAKSVFTVSAATRTITVPTTTLVFGDVNNDNDINITDYNIFKNCWKAPATGACSSSDFDQSGGNVDEVDYNTWLRGFATWQKEGQGL